jgi:hypothetical protein
MQRESREHEERVAGVASNLRIDAATAEVLDAFGTGGVQSRLLKGPALARWLYTDDEPRFYADCDLLVRPDDHVRAEQILVDLGFVQGLAQERMPGWWREHAGDWWRAADAVAIDLHRVLPGAGAPRDEAWDALAANPATVDVAGFEAQSLPLAGRALHVALHAAHHGAERPKPLRDLTRVLEIGDLELWREAAALARQLDAVESLATGLAILPAGRDVAAQLELAPARSVDAALRAGAPPPTALGFEQLAGAPGARERLDIVWRKLVPPPEFMRRWHPLASRGRTGLLLAYLYRPVWLARAMPRGLRAWRAARREVRSRRD